MCFWMICWTTYEVHCGYVVFHPVVSFVECCPMSLVWLPIGRSGKALIQQSNRSSSSMFVQGGPDSRDTFEVLVLCMSLLRLPVTTGSWIGRETNMT